MIQRRIPSFRAAATRFGESFLYDLPSIEALQVGIASRSVRRRFAPEKPEKWVALFAERSESLPFATRVLARDHTDVARERLSVEKSTRIADEDFGRQRRDGSDARMRHQQCRSSALVRHVLHSVVESIDVRLQMLIQRLELAAAIRRMRRQRHRREQRLALAIPQCVAAPHAMRQHDRVQRVLHARPHPDPLMPVQE